MNAGAMGVLVGVGVCSSGQRRRQGSSTGASSLLRWIGQPSSITVDVLLVAGCSLAEASARPVTR